MPQGSFNISRLAARLGLKNVVEWPIEGTIKPVIPLKSGAGLTPVLQAPVAVAGGIARAAVGEQSTWEFISLDPGGVIIQQLEQPVGAPSAFAFTFGPSPAWAAVGPVAHTIESPVAAPAVLSRLNAGTVVGIPPDTDPWLQQRMNPSDPPLWLPRGARMILTYVPANTDFRLFIQFQAIQATEASEEG